MIGIDRGSLASGSTTRLNGFFGSFFRLHTLPRDDDFFRCDCRDVAEDMGMSTDELAIDCFKDVFNAEVASLLGNLRLHGNKELQIPQFFDERIDAMVVDSVDRLVRFFQDRVAKCGRGLFAVPGTSVRCPQVGHDTQEGLGRSERVQRGERRHPK